MVDEWSDLWNNLIEKQSQTQNFLEEVHLMGSGHATRNTSSVDQATGVTQMGLRGISNLRVKFNYPVSVIAGRNGSGKSTVLFAAACAYRVPGDDKRKFLPSKLFPNYRPKQGMHGDEGGEVIINFEYLTPVNKMTMQWRRTDQQRWNRNFLHRRNVSQPERQVYLRTLGNLANRSEVRGVLRMSHMKSMPQTSNLTASQIEFAQQLLPNQYSQVVDLSGDDKANLLVATEQDGAVYSELHMAAGERAILRLSRDIADVKCALVLIDEVEVGLHPVAQKFLMRKLQQLALDNDLQIIATTHSSVVLNSVHKTGRIFLERSEKGEVRSPEPYYDVIQDAFYGQSTKTFNLICEDEGAEAVLNGVFEAIISYLKTKRHSIRIDISAGSGNFAHNARALRRYDQFQNFVFVLDGDQQNNNNNSENTKRKDAKWKTEKGKIIAALAGDKKCRTDEQKQKDWDKYEVRVMFIPGNGGPEEWVWSQIQARPNDFAADLGGALVNFVQERNDLDASSDSADDSTSQKEISDKAKALLHELSSVVPHSDLDICRIVSRLEAKREESDIQPLVRQLKDAFQTWREGA